METKFIKAPDGMSPINAFRALWERAPPFPSSPHSSSLQQQKTVAKACQVAAILRHHQRCDYVGGKILEVNFSHWPLIDVLGYDNRYGQGAAAKAIDQYQKKKSEERFDENDALLYLFSLSP